VSILGLPGVFAFIVLCVRFCWSGLAYFGCMSLCKLMWVVFVRRPMWIVFLFFLTSRLNRRVKCWCSGFVGFWTGFLVLPASIGGVFSSSVICFVACCLLAWFSHGFVSCVVRCVVRGFCLLLVSFLSGLGCLGWFIGVCVNWGVCGFWREGCWWGLFGSLEWFGFLGFLFFCGGFAVG